MLVLALVKVAKHVLCLFQIRQTQNHIYEPQPFSYVHEYIGIINIHIHIVSSTKSNAEQPKEARKKIYTYKKYEKLNFDAVEAKLNWPVELTENTETFTLCLPYNDRRFTTMYIQRFSVRARVDT